MALALQTMSKVLPFAKPSKPKPPVKPIKGGLGIQVSITRVPPATAD